MQTLGALYSTYDDAKKTLDELNFAGFSRDNVSIIANDASNEYGTAVEVHKEEAVTSGQGAGFGAVVGTAIGIAAGLGALLIPGIGPVIAAGPIIAALTGGSIGLVAGGATGGIVGALVKTNKITKEDANIFAEGVRRGNALLLVDAQDEDVSKAQEIMDRNQALDVRELAENWRASGWTAFDDNTPSGGVQAYSAQLMADNIDNTTSATSANNTAPITNFNANAADTNTTLSTEPTLNVTITTASGFDADDPTVQLVGATVTIPASQQTVETVVETVREVTPVAHNVFPILEEELQVGTQQVDKGRVRIYNVVEEIPAQVQITLHEEHVSIERHTMDRPVTDADLAFQEQTFELTETEEHAVVTKTVRVVEEVVISKQVVEHTETVQDTVRRTDVRVEQDGQTVSYVDYANRQPTGVQGANSVALNTTTTVSDQISTDQITNEIDGYEAFSDGFRDHHSANYSASDPSGQDYQTYQTYYRYGYDSAIDPRFGAREWNTVETDIRADWEQTNPEGNWDQVRDPISFAYDVVRSSNKLLR